MTTVTVQRDLLAERRAAAGAFRQGLTDRGILCVNLISSPGAGKTSLLQATAQAWQGRYRAAVLTGDIATDRDAQRLAPYLPVRQLTTGGACHLELPLVQRGWQELAHEELQFLIIENVGNLVCPASHDLGEHLRVVVLSVTEGDDKPGKYPKAFRTSQACLVNKIDLLPYLPFSMEAVAHDARLVQPELQMFPTSATTGAGIEAWCAYLVAERERMLAARDQPRDAAS
jgi:hydrogenase nickel incorporation protein HypB